MTAGKPVGIAEIASAIPAMKISSNGVPLRMPRMIIKMKAMPAIPAIMIVKRSSLLLQRRFVRFGFVEQVRNVPHFGCHTRCRDNEFTTPPRHGSVHKHHIEAVTYARLFADGRRVFERRRALAGQRIFFDFYGRGNE